MKHLFFATEFEAKPFIASLSPLTQKGNVYEGKTNIIIIGTGLINSTISTIKYLQSKDFNSGDQFINMGIAGSANIQLKVGQVVSIRNVNVFTAEDIPSSSQQIWQQSYPEIILSGQYSLASSLHPVWSENARTIANQSKFDLIDMEGYAFAKSCSEMGLQPTLIKSVSDSLEKTSQESFIKNAKQAIKHLHSYYIELE
ncbi:MAG: hypothetical protein NE330_22630 [Lentisphaeraceae bacterium]|nr:hypothetical protein [Lentisphaeraceae bacterium]